MLHFYLQILCTQQGATNKLEVHTHVFGGPYTLHTSHTSNLVCVKTMTLLQLCCGIIKLHLKELNQHWWCWFKIEHCISTKLSHYGKMQRRRHIIQLMIISLTRRWKVLVSWCYLSTKAEMRPLLAVSWLVTIIQC